MTQNESLSVLKRQLLETMNQWEKVKSFFDKVKLERKANWLTDIIEQFQNDTTSDKKTPKGVEKKPKRATKRGKTLA